MVDPRDKTLIIPLCAEIGEYKHSSIYVPTLRDMQDSMQISVLSYWAN